MKGERAVCKNPDCKKEFIKKKYNQNCCGNASCRVIYNRLKKGLSKYPEFMQSYHKGKTVKGRQTSLLVFPEPATNGLGASAVNAVLTTAGASITRAVAGGSFVGNAAGAVVTSTLIPYLKKMIGNRGFSFAPIDNELSLWQSKLIYWQNEKNNVLNGAIPINAMGGAALGGLVGSWVGSEKDRTRNAVVGGVLFGLMGAWLDNQERKQLEYNKAERIADADRHMAECEREILKLTSDRDFYESVIEEKVLVQNEEGVYVVNDELLNSVTSADDYQRTVIASIDFKGPYKYLLGNPGPNFYKIVTGEPGNGKSTYAVKFADYFNRHHGRVLYFPAEQSGEDKDFQNLLKRTNAKGFDIQRKANQCNVEDIISLVGKGQYKMIVLDSVNYMKLSHEDINKIREKLPNLAITAVMQSTKEGGFKGGQEYKHDCNLFLEISNFTAFQTKARSAGAAKMSIEKLVVI